MVSFNKTMNDTNDIEEKKIEDKEVERMASPEEISSLTAKKSAQNEQETPNNGESKPKKKGKGVLRYVLNITFVLVATFLALYFTLKDNFDTVIDYLKNANVMWIAVIVGIMLVMIFIRGTVLFCFARLYTKKYNIFQGIAVDQIGIFYNAVTPGASGGEIMEAYTFNKQGIPISSAVSIMAMYSIVYQGVLIIYGIISFIVKYDFFISLNNWELNLGFVQLSIPMWLLAILGFLLNAGVIALVLLMGYWRGFHNFIMGPCIKFLAKIKIVKKPDEQREKLRIQVENFKIELRRLLTNIPLTIFVSLLMFLLLTCRFSIPYFVGLALGNQSTVATFWDSIFLSNFHQMVTGLIPLPGSSGVSELFFYEIFYNANSPVTGFYFALVDGVDVSQSLTQASLLVWRSMTFSIPLIIAGLVSAFYKASPKEKIQRDEPLPNRGTLTQLQAETMDVRTAEVIEAEQTQSLNRQKILSRLRAINKEEREAKKAQEEAEKKQKEEAENQLFDDKTTSINLDDDEDE